MGKVDRLRIRVEPCAALFWALGIVRVLATPWPSPPAWHPKWRQHVLLWSCYRYQAGGWVQRIYTFITFSAKSLGHRSYVLCLAASLIIRSPRLSSCLNMKKWVNNLVSLSPSYRNMTRLSCRLGAMVRFGVRSTWSRTSGAGWPHTSGSANQKLAW